MDDSENVPRSDSRCSTVSESSSHYYDDFGDLEASLFVVQGVEDNFQVDSGAPIQAATQHTVVASTSALGKRARVESETPLQTPHPAKLAKRGEFRVGGTARVPDGLAPFIVAESTALHSAIQCLPYGAQWEVARFITAGIPPSVFSWKYLWQLRHLKTNAKIAPEISALAMPAGNAHSMPDDISAYVFAKERAVKLPWAELDKEERILNQDPWGGLGCNQEKPYLKDDPDWYGGRVHFVARLVLDSSEKSVDKIPSSFRLILDRPTLGSSNRFARRFGSRRFIRVRVPQEIHNMLSKSGHDDEDLVRFFSRPFIIHEWVFRAFYAKEENVFLYQTCERWKGNKIIGRGSNSHNSPSRELTLHEFLMWHNNAEANDGQSMVKWAARFALGLSTSVPGVRVELDDIKLEDDIVLAPPGDRGQVPNEAIMTDGCGLVHRKVLRQIEETLGWPLGKTVLQMRLGGAKGLLLIDPKSLRDEETVNITLRTSQIKIKMPPADPAALIIDVLKPGRLTTPARLSTETIMNLAENGVPCAVFTLLMKDIMQERVDRLTTWKDPASLYELWSNIARSGGVVSERLAREAGGNARAKGFSSTDDISHKSRGNTLDEDDLDEFNDPLQEHSTAWWADHISGCPSSLEETALVLLDAGFSPDNCHVLAAKLREVAKKTLSVFLNGFHIDVRMSCKAFVAPDPLGVLEAGEIHIRSSSRNLVDQSGNITDLVLGDVLVTRHPCKIPTDVQKAKAVFHERLRSYTDVILVSTKGHVVDHQFLHQHLASLTGGGDYDGDIMEVFWEPSIVSNFTSALPASFSREPPDLQSSLIQNKETVAEFLHRMSTQCSQADVLSEYQKFLLGALRDTSRVGTYSTWWESSIYKRGYSHHETVFLAYMFTSLLDGSKSGITVSPQVFVKHRSLYDIGPAPWNRSDGMIDTRKIIRRDERLPPFILDELKQRIDQEKGLQEKRIMERLPDKRCSRPDEDLVKPWNDAVARAAEALEKHSNPWVQDELEAIRRHVEELREEHSAAHVRCAGKIRNAKRVLERTKSGSLVSKVPIEQRQDMLRELSQKFDRGPTIVVDGKEIPRPLIYFDSVSLRRVRASYAYVHDHKAASSAGWSRFPWNVALGALCEIKAAAVGPSKTVTNDFYTRMTIAKAFLRPS